MIPSLILRTTARLLMALLLLLSVFLLLRGHNEPGGGFIGGLVGASAFLLYALACDTGEARRILRVDPATLIPSGFAVALVSGLFAWLAGKPLLTGLWDKTPIPVIGKLGTPLLFDIGVYLVVIGFVLTIIFNLSEDDA